MSEIARPAQRDKGDQAQRERAMSEISTVATKGQPDDGPFRFLAELLALDLVNTQLVVRGKPHDLLTTPEEAARWWEVARRHHPELPVVRQSAPEPVIDAALLDRLRTLRGALRGFFGALADQAPPRAEDIESINAVLRAGAQEFEDNGTGLRIVYVTEDAHGGILLPIAVSALTWLSTGDRRRLHRCGNERCVLLFYDTTKSGTRRWCSLGCMDRARSAQRYQRAKQQSQADG
jgi:predicted RNA-binding Zn ribbon-like protein